MRVSLFCGWMLLVIGHTSSVWANKPGENEVGKTISAQTLHKISKILLWDFHAIKKVLPHLGKKEEVMQGLSMIIFDAKHIPFARSRAISILGLYPEESTLQVYKKVLASNEMSDFLKRKALELMSLTFKEAAIEPAILFLKAKDVALRRVALRVISLYPRPTLKIHLQRYALQEKNVFLQKKVQVTLVRWRSLPSLSPPSLRVRP